MEEMIQCTRPIYGENPQVRFQIFVLKEIHHHSLTMIKRNTARIRIRRCKSSLLLSPEKENKRLTLPYFLVVLLVPGIVNKAGGRD